jgi:hypothetical protein
MPSSPAPLCYAALPSGAADAIYAAVRVPFERAGWQVVRADFGPDGFAVRSMFEALLVADQVVVDLSQASPVVTYVLGMRDGASAGRGTLVIGEEGALASLPIGLRPARAIPYQASALSALSAALAERLAAAAPPENTLVQITSTRPGASGHEKTDLFAQRTGEVSAVGAQVAEILRGGEPLARLRRLEEEVLSGAAGIPQLHTGLLAIYLGYRAKKGWSEMVALYQKMPRELQESAVAREQLALAYNRIAEGLHGGEATETRRKAIATVEAIPRDRWTSETFGILGRIHKGHADAEAKAAEGNPERAAQVRAALSAAIKAYEDGFKADPRDYYPGVNAVTLRILRQASEDETALAVLLPIVRFAVNRAPAPANRDESYWQGATRLELAAAARDWPAAQFALEELLKLPVDRWMRETTAGNLEKQARARASEPDAQRELGSYVAALEAG